MSYMTSARARAIKMRDEFHVEDFQSVNSEEVIFLQFTYFRIKPLQDQAHSEELFSSASLKPWLRLRR
ncbi:hypothetical protein GOP47_0027723 [Adiantum capillus-veneris]|nr:hypothetical protein GOP47_0027723 [Adiantum capillus-veneris]